MSISKALVLLVLTAAAPAGPAIAANAPRLGQPADPARLAAWDIDVSPDGTGLPPGRGAAADGALLYVQKCAMCHGPAGRGGPAPRLTGGIGSLKSGHPVKTVNSYWPYATTLFGYVRAAMPIKRPRSLSASQLYALCAYLLSMDNIVPHNAVLDAGSLAAVRMPNRDGFESVWKPRKAGGAHSGGR